MNVRRCFALFASLSNATCAAGQGTSYFLLEVGNQWTFENSYELKDYHPSQDTLTVDEEIRLHLGLPSLVAGRYFLVLQTAREWFTAPALLIR